jgi:hypothetical protein
VLEATTSLFPKDGCLIRKPVKASCRQAAQGKQIRIETCYSDSDMASTVGPSGKLEYPVIVIWLKEIQFDISYIDDVGVDVFWVCGC